MKPRYSLLQNCYFFSLTGTVNKISCPKRRKISNARVISSTLKAARASWLSCSQKYRSPVGKDPAGRDQGEEIQLVLLFPLQRGIEVENIQEGSMSNLIVRSSNGTSWCQRLLEKE